MNKYKNCIIITRVSSKEQETQYSLDSQNFDLKQIAEYYHLNILKEFRLVESGWRNRRHFEEVNKFVLNYKQNTPLLILTDSVDRFQRRLNELITYQDLIKQGKCAIFFKKENLLMNENSTTNEFSMWRMMINFSESYVENLSSEVKKGQRQMFREGKWSFSAPPGYMGKNKWKIGTFN